jgi:hypothetical protein
MGEETWAFQDIRTVLRRFGNSAKTARQSYKQFLQKGLDAKGDESELVSLVRQSNEGIEAGRSIHRWVIGDPEFARKVIDAEEQSRLRITRFEKDGCDLQAIAIKIAGAFGVGTEDIRQRSRGGIGSQARKAFVYVAVREYGAPSRLVADYCSVGLAAVSFLAKPGRKIVQENNLSI